MLISTEEADGVGPRFRGRGKKVGLFQGAASIACFALRHSRVAAGTKEGN
jgi:hypothetical protein